MCNNRVRSDGRIERKGGADTLTAGMNGYRITSMVVAPPSGELSRNPHSVYPALPVSFGGDTKSRRSLLSGVYDMGSKRSHQSALESAASREGRQGRQSLGAPGSAGSRLRGARGIYYPRGPFAADLQHLSLQRVQEKQWRQKDKLSTGERGYRMAVLTE